MIVIIMSALKAYVGDLKKTTTERVIRSNFFLEILFLTFLALHTEEKVWPDGTHPILFAEASYVCMPKL